MMASIESIVTRPMPEIKWTWNLGDLITITVLLVGMAVIWGQVSTKLDEHGRTLAVIQAQQAETVRQIIAIQLEQERVRTTLELKEGIVVKSRP